MEKKITIVCLNTNTKKDYNQGIRLNELAQMENVKLPFPILGALVNNKVHELDAMLYKPSQVQFFDITSLAGNAMYLRSLYFLMFKAVSDLYPEAKLLILHSIAGGKFCELRNLGEPLTEHVLNRIKEHMQMLVKKNLPFKRTEMPTAEAMEEYVKHGLTDKTYLFKNRTRIYTSVYYLDDKVNYYYGYLVPSTGYLTLFDLQMYGQGFLLKLPTRKHPDSISVTRHMPKLAAVYKQYRDWVNLIGVPYVGDLNNLVEQGKVQEFIAITEAYHEKIMANIADEIHNRGTVKMVLISGPSSSGKTTTCKRLSVQLRVLGYHPVQISMDDFFVEREETPRDAKGNYDFEALEALDLKLFAQVMDRLLKGEEVEIPTFNFSLGKKEWKGKTIQLQSNSIILLEGIHCLNPRLTKDFDDAIKYKIFASALTSISLDSQNPIPTTDNRLVRRIIRDYRYRGYSALDTLRRWQSVRDGEDRNIFPYQENADVMFNTSLIIEMGILKSYATAILDEVPETEPEYSEAIRLKKFLSYFRTISEDNLPGTSILREFVGGSSFSYK